MYKAKFLNAFSVRFDPVKWEDIKPENEDGKDEQNIMVRPGRDYKSQELLEISPVTIPANASALINRDFQNYLSKAAILDRVDIIDDPKEKEKFLKGLIIAEDEEPKPLLEKDDKDKPAEKPYENEHSCRLKPPGDYKTCRRTTRKSDGKEYSILTCQRKDDATKWEEQAFRYNKQTWSESEAKTHCKEHDGTFEAARKSEENEEIIEKQQYNCECIKCGYTMKTDKHCKDITCPECGGEMRRAERPGPGRNINAEDTEIKSGRVLSAKNKTIVQKCIEALNELIKATETDDEEDNKFIDQELKDLETMIKSDDEKNEIGNLVREAEKIVSELS